MVYLPRGIDPKLLLSQVKNTMPYLFDLEVNESPLGQFLPGKILRAYSEEDQSLSHFEYFRLCLCSHYLTCATPVPTDVDNQIRHKLWPAALPLETALQMAQLVVESYHWDFVLVSNRVIHGLGGHMGEWFTVATAAYCALQQYSDSQAQEQREILFESIRELVQRHSEVFGLLWNANDGLNCLKASAQIAHNFGDLDRVMDMWDLSVADPLRLEFYHLAKFPFDSNRKLRYWGRLWVAGELYKSPILGSSMAFENHRHFALRKPRCLRNNRVFLVPTGPFFDDWGRKVAEGLPHREELEEVVHALAQGWGRLPQTVGYGRALRGILEISPDSPDSKKSWIQETPRLAAALDLPQELFEKKWNEEALRWMDDIPSRA